MSNPVLSIGALAATLPDASSQGDLGIEICDITYDSRAVLPGSLYVALRGAYFDGHAFVQDAVAAGAAAVVVEEPLTFEFPTIVVPDTRAALSDLAAKFYDYPSRSLTTIGITGTDGKTTTSYLLNSIFRTANKKTGMIGTISLRIGDQYDSHESRQTTPESLDIQRHLRAMVEADVEFAILEATSHGLSLHRLDNVAFGIGAVTNITTEHLELHKTVEAYRRAKSRLFEMVASEHGTVIINLDDEGARSMIPYASGAAIATYGIDNPQANVVARNVTIRRDGADFIMMIEGGEVAVNLPLTGSFNVANALCAAAIAHASGVGLIQIAEGLSQAEQVPGRMTIVDEGQPFSVYVDYAHTPESLTRVLQLLRSLVPTAQIICVCGSAGERDTVKRPLQGEVCHRLADFTVFTTEDPRFEVPDQIIAEIASGAVAAGGEEGKTFMCITDRREAISHAFNRATPTDVVLLAGKGHERSIVWGLEKRPWNEELVAAEVLRELGWLAPKTP